MEKQIHCLDASITAMIALPNKSNKWDIFAISKVHGMGKADYNKKVFDFDFIEVVPLNTTNGLSYVCLNKDNKWGLLELKYNDTIQCKWKLITDFIYNDMDSMLNEMKVDRKEFVPDFKDDSDIVINADKVIDFHNSLFNPIDWLTKFRIASQNKTGFRELRADIYQQTIQLVKRGVYYVDDLEIKLNNSEITQDTTLFKKPKHLIPSNKDIETKYAVLEADCIESAELLKKAGYNVCLLNMANRQNPGGGVLGGAGAQEENIFRRSNIFLSLYQFVNYSNQYGVKRNVDDSYPLDMNSGGIYSKDVTIFRGSEKNGYCLLKNPFKLSIVSVPAINKPELDFINEKFYISKKLIEPSKEKIRTILRISGLFNHDCLVLGAFGCGAFCNPPEHMAKLFKEVFNEPEFINRFELIVFSILDDHNSWKKHNPEGNTLPFYKEFENNFE